jgi:hypothetical protein
MYQIKMSNSEAGDAERVARDPLRYFGLGYMLEKIQSETQTSCFH